MPDEPYILYYNYIPNVGDIKKEQLLNICFPSGAYIFGERYDTEYFDKFFKELQEVKPKYVDELNHSLYYPVEDGATAFLHYETVWKKYRDNNEKRFKQWQIQQKREELKRLEEQFLNDN